MDDVVCKHCKKGDDEDRLLLCEECNAAQHTYCCNPPLTDVPESKLFFSFFSADGVVILLLRVMNIGFIPFK